MKKITYLIIVVAATMIVACGGGDGQSRKDKILAKSVKDPYQNWQEYKGVGPIKDLTLPEQVDAQLASKGLEIFDSKCTACHKAEKKFIGPAPKDILSRRNPEWIMNMILAPEKMVAEDPIAKKLLVEFNGSPMANQNLTEEEARAVLEYFRTL
ncbi:MAG: cytochrome c [Fulvivirga sp.]|uniref:c-type cytochrome n=1 Tax=Fulvivirga sp. TaxID=1931237 RepID=UPI0032EB4682